MFFLSYATSCDLHSFPTRRSSDLVLPIGVGDHPCGIAGIGPCSNYNPQPPETGRIDIPRGHLLARSEEHTSELQSRFDLVCRLLLEKKKITKNFFHLLFNLPP